ncbi:RidA family protein [Rhodococcus sp. P1Y]|uniref:RidA family protein n=1 Tax=Rhodococcus sp. P1Y TaxID=1302308 RepID=UPI000EB2392F|nr:RidA family protein [Rhodococcus sp. P1Y]AYJ48891.1 RidA family protein [Rhodococcus sp. P1Y]
MEEHERRQINSPSVAAPRGHFSHAVVAQDTIYVSGLLAFDDKGVITAPGDVRGQTQRIFEILEHILHEARATLADTVQLTTYVTDIGQRAPVNEVRKQLFGTCRPASTLVEVSALAAEGAVIEIDAIAVRTRA